MADTKPTFYLDANTIEDFRSWAWCQHLAVWCCYVSALTTQMTIGLSQIPLIYTAMTENQIRRETQVPRKVKKIV